MILYIIYDFFVSFFIHAWRTINSFFSLFLDDGGDSAYNGKEELQRLDILLVESIYSEAQSNVVDDSDDDSDDDVHS